MRDLLDDYNKRLYNIEEYIRRGNYREAVKLCDELDISELNIKKRYQIALRKMISLIMLKDIEVLKDFIAEVDTLFDKNSKELLIVAAKKFVEKRGILLPEIEKLLTSSTQQDEVNELLTTLETSSPKEIPDLVVRILNHSNLKDQDYDTLARYLIEARKKKKLRLIMTLIIIEKSVNIDRFRKLLQYLLQHENEASMKSSIKFFLMKYCD